MRDYGDLASDFVLTLGACAMDPPALPAAGSHSRRKARVAVIYKLQQLCNTPEVKATGSPATAQLE